MYSYTITFTFILLAVHTSSCRDLTTEPGHLKPFGEGRPSQPVPEIEGFPNARYFFENNVIPLRPLKMKGAAKSFPAFEKWTDDYFLSLDEPADHKVAVETEKKENRKQQMLDMSFKEFVGVYNESTYYMVNAVPAFIRQDIGLPCPLQCKSIVEENLADHVMWFSSGGTNSVVHTDSYDNMNCLLRGNKTLVMVDPALYRDKVDIDHPEGAYSDVDVDSVDYLKYPGLADVEFYHVNVTAGDCLYIPYKWIHQVRSFGSNLAVNVWWHHFLKEEVDFEDCNTDCDPNLTLADGKFHHMDGQEMPPEEVRDHFLSLVSLSQPLDFPRFVGKLLNGISYGDLGENNEYRTGLGQVFSLVDMDKDGVLTQQEIMDTTDETYEEVWNIIAYLENADGQDDDDDLYHALNEELEDEDDDDENLVPPEWEQYLMEPGAGDEYDDDNDSYDHGDDGTIVTDFGNEDLKAEGNGDNTLTDGGSVSSGSRHSQKQHDEF